jgi:histidinol dehydrogenase
MKIITLARDETPRVAKLFAQKTDDAAVAGLRQTVRGIINDVRNGGDLKLVDYTNKLDRNNLRIEQLRVSETEIDAAYNEINQFEEPLIAALIQAAKRVEAYYTQQLPKDLDYKDKQGVRLGVRWNAVDSVGLYVPGGTATYPSSVIMNAVPAKVAGVARIAMVCPAMDGNIEPIVLAAAKICGITEIYRVGGAQAIAALAYGTETIAPVDKIVGPGNAYVAEAKRQVFGKVGIDMIAGPSEILVIADADNEPSWIAADLLSQAEHDADARAVLVTDNMQFAQNVVSAIYETLPKLKRREIAEKSITKNGYVIVVEDLAHAAEVANVVATEHLELAVAKPDALLPLIRHAGAIFMGRFTPEAIGDYMAGPSHVLPTSGTARFSSGLSIFDFMKRQSLIGCDSASFKKLAEATELLANKEGLTAHALSVSVRREN